MTPATRRGLRTVVALAGTFSALLWVWHQVDPSERAAALRAVDPKWLALAVLLVPVQTLLAAERWRQVSLALALPMSRREAWSEFGLSTAVNQLLPGGIGGDVLRVWRQREAGLVRATRSAVVDRWWGQTALALLVALGVFFWPSAADRPAGLATGAAIAGSLVFGVWLVPASLPGVGPLAADLRASARQVSTACTLLSVLLLVAILGGFAACGWASGHPPGPWLWSAAPVALLAASLPVSAGGWGLREGSLVVLLPLLGWSPADALALSIWFGFTFAMGALPGLLLFLRPRTPGKDSP